MEFREVFNRSRGQSDIEIRTQDESGGYDVRHRGSFEEDGGCREGLVNFACVCVMGGAQLRLLAVAVPRIRYHLLIMYIHELGDWKNGARPIMTAFWIHICEERIANITQARRHDSEMYGIMRHLCPPLDMVDTKLLVIYKSHLVGRVLL
jgi:hypothetical protein